MKLDRTDIVLSIVGAGSFLGAYALKERELSSSIFYAILLALFTSTIFFFIATVLPEKQRRRRVRNRLKRQYQTFKERCIDLFLIASNSQGYRDRDNLLDHQEFRRYFSKEHPDGRSRWGMVASCIDAQDYIFKEILMEFDLLSREVDFARIAVDIDDEGVESHLVNLTHIIYTLKMAEADSDDYKYFSRTLWGIFSRFNVVDGQLEEDIIEKTIERI